MEYYDDDLISFTNLHGVSNKKFRLREYVDVMQNKELVQAVKDLLYKLKELFYNRKMKPQKGKYKKVNLAPKKRYLIGLKENMKYLQARKINMIIIATNIEKVDGDRGLDEFLYNMIKECQSQDIPVVFAMTRQQLGTVCKYRGEKASVVGIFNFQGANDEFNNLVKMNQQNRTQFYQKLQTSFDH